MDAYQNTSFSFNGCFSLDWNLLGVNRFFGLLADGDDSFEDDATELST
jgi:hypothetical protein